MDCFEWNRRPPRRNDGDATRGGGFQKRLRSIDVVHINDNSEETPSKNPSKLDHDDAMVDQGGARHDAAESCSGANSLPSSLNGNERDGRSPSGRSRSVNAQPLGKRSEAFLPDEAPGTAAFAQAHDYSRDTERGGLVKPAGRAPTDERPRAVTAPGGSINDELVRTWPSHTSAVSSFWYPSRSASRVLTCQLL